MDSYDVLKRAIPDGSCKAVALQVHRTPDQVRRWRRKPLDSDDPLSTGQRSPLDAIKLLIGGVFLVNPNGAGLIAQDVWSYYQGLRDAHLNKTEWDKRHHAAETLREAVEAINCLNLDAPDEQTLIEIAEARDAFDQALARLRKQKAMADQRPALRVERARTGT